MLHCGYGGHGFGFAVVPDGRGGCLSILALDNVAQILVEGVLTTVLAAAWIGVVVGEGTFVGRTARVVNERILQRIYSRIPFVQGAAAERL